jgi:excisionase family DNA binding protein
VSALIEPVCLPDRERGEARELREAMQAGCTALVGPDGRRHAIPTAVNELFLRVLEDLQDGRAVSIVPWMQELTTQDAAKLLGVSRQFLVRLLDAGDIPFHFAGTHRRIYLKDLLAYKHQRDQQRRQALKRMVEADLAAGLYDKVVMPDD